MTDNEEEIDNEEESIPKDVAGRVEIFSNTNITDTQSKNKVDWKKDIDFKDWIGDNSIDSGEYLKDYSNLSCFELFLVFLMINSKTFF